MVMRLPPSLRRADAGISDRSGVARLPSRNMVGKVELLFAFAILGLRIAGWALGEASWATHWDQKP